MEEIRAVFENDAKRIDAALAQLVPTMSRNSLARLIENGNVEVNGEVVTEKKMKVRAGDRVSISLPEPEILDVRPENIPLDIVYEDSDVLVVNKPKGMVVHPGAGNFTGTLVNAVMYHCGDSLSSINGVIRP